MSFLSKQSNSFLRSFALGRKYLAWKEESEMRALQARYAQLTWEIAELGNEMSRRKGLMTGDELRQCEAALEKSK